MQASEDGGVSSIAPVRYRSPNISSSCQSKTFYGPCVARLHLDLTLLSGVQTFCPQKCEDFSNFVLVYSRKRLPSRITEYDILVPLLCQSMSPSDDYDGPIDAPWTKRRAVASHGELATGTTRFACCHGYCHDRLSSVSRILALWHPQARSREAYRIAAQLDIFRLLSFYYSSVGGFMNQVGDHFRASVLISFPVFRPLRPSEI